MEEKNVSKSTTFDLMPCRFKSFRIIKTNIKLVNKVKGKIKDVDELIKKSIEDAFLSVEKEFLDIAR